MAAITIKSDVSVWLLGAVIDSSEQKVQQKALSAGVEWRSTESWWLIDIVNKLHEVKISDCVCVCVCVIAVCDFNLSPPSYP